MSKALTASQMELLLRITLANKGGYAVTLDGTDLQVLMDRGYVYFDEVHSNYKLTVKGSKLIDSFKTITVVT